MTKTKTRKEAIEPTDWNPERPIYLQLIPCACKEKKCERNVLMISDQILRRNTIGKEEKCKCGMTAIATLDTPDLIDLIIQCNKHLEDMGYD